MSSPYVSRLTGYIVVLAVTAVLIFGKLLGWL